ncbi:FAD-dependent oxidoreductase, partial [Staphylococcus pseudintermedius]
TENLKVSDHVKVCTLGRNDSVGIVYGREITGNKAAFMKRVIDTRSIFKIGGLGLAYKKGKF